VPLLADGNLVDAAWAAAQPELPLAPMRIHALEWAGQGVADKLTNMRQRMQGGCSGRGRGGGGFCVVVDVMAWQPGVQGSSSAAAPCVITISPNTNTNKTSTQSLHLQPPPNRCTAHPQPPRRGRC